MTAQIEKRQRYIGAVAVDGRVKEADQGSQLFIYDANSCVGLFHRRRSRTWDQSARFTFLAQDGEETILVWKAPKRPESSDGEEDEEDFGSVKRHNSTGIGAQFTS